MYTVPITDKEATQALTQKNLWKTSIRADDLKPYGKDALHKNHLYLNAK